MIKLKIYEKKVDSHQIEVILITNQLVDSNILFIYLRVTLGIKLLGGWYAV